MKRIAICGLSNRALSMFIKPVLERYSNVASIVALLDQDPKRRQIVENDYPELAGVRFFLPEAFASMVESEQVDTLIVTSRDDTHVAYILQGLAYDLDVICEKPMVTTAADAQRVLEAEKASKGTVTVTFNYRYNPIHLKIKEMVASGKLGKITSVDLNWYIDTYHGASYFKRWNRMRAFSGGLSIHKSTHHFDLVNWWLAQSPKEVFAYGSLHYYGQQSVWNPSKQNGRHCGACTETDKCAYYARWFGRSINHAIKDDHLLAGQNMDAYSNYRPDACIFDEEIEIEDTYTVSALYEHGALLSYSVNFSLPYEGYRLAINGTEGRLETQEYHAPARIPFPVPDQQVIDFYPLFGAKETIYVVEQEGGHGGGDTLIQEEIFLGESRHRPYRVLAGAEAGALAVAMGEGVWRSVKDKQPIKVNELLYASPTTSPDWK